MKIVHDCAKFYGEKNELLQSTFEFLTNCLKVKALQADASKTIATICKENTMFVNSNLEDFLKCKHFLLYAITFLILLSLLRNV